MPYFMIHGFIIFLFVFRKRTPKAPAQNKERKKSEKRKPQTLAVSDESEELESEVISFLLFVSFKFDLYQTSLGSNIKNW